MQMHAAVGFFSYFFLSGRCDQRFIHPFSVNSQQILLCTLPAPLKKGFYSGYIESNKYTILAPDISRCSTVIC